MFDSLLQGSESKERQSGIQLLMHLNEANLEMAQEITERFKRMLSGLDALDAALTECESPAQHRKLD